MSTQIDTLIGVLNVLADVTPFPNETQRSDLKVQIASLSPDYVPAPEAAPVVKPDESGVVNSDSHDLEGTPHSAPAPVEDPAAEIVSAPGIPNPTPEPAPGAVVDPTPVATPESDSEEAAEAADEAAEVPADSTLPLSGA